MNHNVLSCLKIGIILSFENFIKLKIMTRKMPYIMKFITSLLNFKKIKTMNKTRPNNLTRGSVRCKNELVGMYRPNAMFFIDHLATF